MLQFEPGPNPNIICATRPEGQARGHADLYHAPHLDSITLTIIQGRVTFWSSSFCSFLHFAVTSSLLGSVSAQHLVLKYNKSATTTQIQRLRLITKEFRDTRTRRSIITFTRTAIGPYPEPVESTARPPANLSKIDSDPILQCTPRFSAGFSTKTLYNFLSSPMRATCLAHLILLDLICLMIFGDEYKFEARHWGLSLILIKNDRSDLTFERVKPSTSNTVFFIHKETRIETLGFWSYE
jgi:hypothetical protein